MIDKKFIPTKQMIALLRAMIDGEGKPTVTNFCEQAGISRTTYYNWFNDEDFVKWFDSEWAKLMSRKVSWLDRIGLMKSPTDFRYWEALQTKYANYKKRTDITSDDKKISAGIFIDDPEED